MLLNGLPLKTYDITMYLTLQIYPGLFSLVETKSNVQLHEKVEVSYGVLGIYFNYLANEIE